MDNVVKSSQVLIPTRPLHTSLAVSSQGRFHGPQRPATRPGHVHTLIHHIIGVLRSVRDSKSCSVLWRCTQWVVVVVTVGKSAFEEMSESEGFLLAWLGPIGVDAAGRRREVGIVSW